MSEHCPQDGGFIGDAGCTHPNHQHSELVKGIMSGEPAMISPRDATAALNEGFYVKNPEGKQVGFGKKLLADLGIKGDFEGIGHVALGYVDEGGVKPASPRKENYVYWVQ